MKRDGQLGGKLFALAEVDHRAVELLNEKKTIDDHRAAVIVELDRRKSIKDQTEYDFKEKDKIRSDEENLLATEENKILERRKQIQGVSGVKAAKITERGMEISARSLQSIEERISNAMLAVENAEKRLELINAAVNDLSVFLSSSEAEYTSKISKIDDELSSLKKEREILIKDISKIDDRVVGLYERIRSRYPGDPVAAASGASCRSCYRALPNQLFNLILAGNTRIQCPSCSRILVLVKERSNDKAA